MEWVVIGLVVMVMLVALITMFATIFPLEEVCFGCSSACQGFGEGGVQPLYIPDRICPRCGGRWSSGDPFGWEWMLKRVRRAIR